MAKGESAKTLLPSKKLAKPLLSGEAGPPQAASLGGKFLGFFRRNFRDFQEFSGLITTDLAKFN